VSSAALVIETSGLRKVYGRKLALADLSLEVRAGEAFGLLGPNGAGKSTCLKLLLGLARPTAGHGRLLGRPLGDIPTRRRVGFLPEHFHFQEWLSGAEVLQLHGRLFGLAPEILRRRVPELLERVGLGAQGAKPLREYSKGMQQRLGLAQALVNEPELIFLDEPTSGLDPLGRLLVREVIREQRQRGAAVFLNSHLLGEVEVSCDRVAFVKDGCLLETRDLRAASAAGGPSLRLRLRARDLPADFWRRAVPVARAEKLAGDAWALDVAAEAAIPELLRALLAAGAQVFELTPLPQSLEEIFLRVIGRDGGDA